MRGLHYQLRPAEKRKLIYVLAGRVYDVAVDIRRGSPWFGIHVGVVLEPGAALWIPPGFVHGFQALEDSYFLLQTSTAPYMRGVYTETTQKLE